MPLVIEIAAHSNKSGLVFQTHRRCRCHPAAAVQTGHSPSAPAPPSSLLALALFSMGARIAALPVGAVPASLRCQLTERRADPWPWALMQGLRLRDVGSGLAPGGQVGPSPPSAVPWEDLYGAAGVAPAHTCSVALLHTTLKPSSRNWGA